MTAATASLARPVGHSRLGSLASHALLILTSLVVILPLLWVLRTAFVNRYDAYLLPPKLDAPLTLENFRQIFVVDEFTPYIINSLLVASGVTALALLLGGARRLRDRPLPDRRLAAADRPSDRPDVPADRPRHPDLPARS